MGPFDFPLGPITAPWLMENLPGIPTGSLNSPAAMNVLQPAIVNPNIASQVERSRQQPRPSPSEGFMNYLSSVFAGIRQNFPIDSPESVRRAAYDLALGWGPGAIVYHGSPHNFTKFDMSKIGTGEGAQAYGHGLYFAENPATARAYQEQLGGVNTVAKTPAGKIAFDAGAPSGAEQFAANFLKAHKGNKDKAIAFIKELERDGDYFRATPGFSKEIIGVLENGGISSVSSQKLGSFYKVDLPDSAIAKMLDWDKPLSQQPESVRKSIASAYEKLKAEDPYHAQVVAGAIKSDSVGGTIYSAFQEGFARGEGLPGIQEATKRMNEAGIPGIRYLDQGSRASGKGTYNYVVFDDQIPTIIGRE